MSTKKISKDSKKVKTIRNYVSIMYAEIMYADFQWKNATVSRTQELCHVDLLYVKYKCAKFHHCRIYVTDHRDGGIFSTPLPSLNSPEKAYPE